MPAAQNKRVRMKNEKMKKGTIERKKEETREREKSKGKEKERKKERNTKVSQFHIFIFCIRSKKNMI